MQQITPTKQLPKQTKIIIVALAILGILAVILVKDGKSKKASKILHSLGYNHIKDVRVYAKKEFIAEATNTKGFQYSLEFIDLDKNQLCKGFILKDFKRNIDKDLRCVDIKESK